MQTLTLNSRHCICRVDSLPGTLKGVYGGHITQVLREVTVPEGEGHWGGVRGVLGRDVKATH